MDSSDLESRLSAIAERWNIVEGRIKEVQHINSAVFIPAINELRYAGRRIVDAWAIYQDNSINDESKYELINDALTVVEQYAENAEHDVTDAMCVFLHLKIQAMIERYSLRRVHQFHPDIFEFLTKMNTVNDIIAESRKDRSRRNHLYDRLEQDYVPYLKSKYESLFMSEKTMEMERIIGRRKAIARWTLDGVLLLIAVLGMLEVFWPQWNN